MVEVNAETDFVAKNEKFQNYAADVAAQALVTTAADIDTFMGETWTKDTTMTVKEALSSQISIIGENMNIRRFARFEAEGLVEKYIHGDGKIAVLVNMKKGTSEVAKDVCMQIAAARPEYLNEVSVPAERVEKRKKKS